MAGATFHHFGVPSTSPREGEIHLEEIKIFVTDPEANPFRIEFVRFEEGSPLPEQLRKTCHAAFMVDDIDAVLEGKSVLIPPFDATETLRAAFITDGDALIELLQVIK